MSAAWEGYQGEVTFYLRLPAEPLSAREARRAITTWALSRGLGPDVDDLSLVTSELVANATSHGAGPVTLEAMAAGGSVHVRVTDHGAGTPERREPGLDDDHGRGLMIVSALARSWGSRVGDASTEVWAELFLGPR